MSPTGGGMSSFVKAALIVLAVMVVFGSIAIFAGWMWWKSNRSAIETATLKAREEGEKAGATRNEQECLDLVVSRTSKETKFTEVISSGLFLGSCLETSKTAEGFCKDVPPDSEFSETVRWRKQKCTSLKLDHSQCSALLSVVQTYCHHERKQLGK